MTPEEYCKSVLAKVSRTFAINIAVLRGTLNNAVGTSYLLCRILDTVEDSEFTQPGVQEELLLSFKDMFLKDDLSAPSLRTWKEAFFGAIAPRDEETNYYDLIHNMDLVVQNYLSLSAASRKAIASCVAEMADGMQEMLARKESAGSSAFFLETTGDLEKYCYYVAGTVGLLATRLFSEYSNYFRRFDQTQLAGPAVDLGLGLQMVNIIKDCHSDFQRGVCYFPREMFAPDDNTPSDPFSAQDQEKTLRLLSSLSAKAAEHLDRAMESVLSFPRRAFRIRLSCLWPLFLAICTLVETKDNPRLLNGEKVRISRASVARIIRRTTVFCCSNRALRSYFNGFRKQLVSSDVA